MKKVLLILIFAFILGFSSLTNAGLVPIGDDLVYDSDLDITWHQNPRIGGQMTWDQANAYIDNLNSIEYLGYDDWRLPHTLPVSPPDYNLTFSYDGSTDHGYNITSPNSEMAYMYYLNLGNIGEYDTDAKKQDNYGAQNSGPFEDIYFNDYWSGTDRGSRAYEFLFHTGCQRTEPKYSTRHIWPVRDGISTAIPIPSAAWLLGSSLIGLLVFERKKFKK